MAWGGIHSRERHLHHKYRGHASTQGKGQEEETAGDRGRGGEVMVNKDWKVEPTGNSEPKSVLKSFLSTSSKILVVPESMPICAIIVCS